MTQMSPDHVDYRLATLLRIDPERLAALRRARSGMTMCPNCCEPTRADQRYCEKCGAALYPDLESEKRDEAGKETRKD